ncbi:hypothetical protein [Rhodopseudomonas sp. RCAM05734]|uniref:hypothetical protein n=1 Tax=Rhodopseudomonas sp. RCAM05734 TaxID=3457549 RepID=UPI004044FC14
MVNPHRFLLWFPLLLLSAAGCEADVCDDLGKVLKEAAKNYSTWKSEPLKEANEFGSTFVLGGATRCKIELDRDTSSSEFSCRWRFAKGAEVAAPRDAIVSDIRNCRYVNNPDNKVKEYPTEAKNITIGSDTYRRFRAYFQISPKKGRAFSVSVTSSTSLDNSMSSSIAFSMSVDYEDVQ